MPVSDEPPAERVTLQDVGLRQSIPWRISLRHIMLAILLIGFGLAVYRGGPEVIEQIYPTEPYPLIVKDKTKIHIRQVAILPLSQFAYRVYLPEPHEYELCLGDAGDDESLPEPIEALPLSGIKPSKYLEEYFISGFVTRSANKQFEQQVVIMPMRRSRGGAGDEGVMQHPVSRGEAGCRIFRLRGTPVTEVCEPDKEIILYRQIQFASDNDRLRDVTADSAGRGLVIWLRPKKKP